MKTFIKIAHANEDVSFFSKINVLLHFLKNIYKKLEVIIGFHSYVSIINVVFLI